MILSPARLAAFVAAIALLFAAAPGNRALSAQSPAGASTPGFLADAPFVLDVRGGASIGELASAASGLDFDPGPVVSLSLLRGIRADLIGYLRYARSTFGCRRGFCSAAEVDLGGHGVGAGVEWHPGFFRLEGGLVFHSARASWDWTTEDGMRVEGSESSRWGAGFELGTGFEFMVADRFLVAPGVRYVRFNSDFAGSPPSGVEGGSNDYMTWFAADLGLRIPVP